MHSHVGASTELELRVQPAPAPTERGTPGGRKPSAYGCQRPPSLCLFAERSYHFGRGTPRRCAHPPATGSMQQHLASFQRR